VPENNSETGTKKTKREKKGGGVKTGGRGLGLYTGMWKLRCSCRDQSTNVDE
jgi:hypothetical protein